MAAWRSTRTTSSSKTSISKGFASKCAGLIKYSRGRIVIADRDGLLQRSCSCLTVMHDEERRPRETDEAFDIGGRTDNGGIQLTGGNSVSQMACRMLDVRVMPEELNRHSPAGGDGKLGPIGRRIIIARLAEP